MGKKYSMKGVRLVFARKNTWMHEFITGGREAILELACIKERVSEHGMDGAYVEVIEGVQNVVDKEEKETSSIVVKGISETRIQDIMVVAIDS
ncbi:unnamed protein product [Linum trigynum]|uniref:Uncharacterized protein n=1 Tax=Linum trigynum TaxID=586398 RepID=A0AAV2CTD4_9ROSI